MLQCEQGESDDGSEPEASSAGAFVISLTGTYDLSEVRGLRSDLERALAEHDVVHVDLSGLHAIDSACLRELLRAQALAARDHRIFGVSVTSARAWRLLDRADALDLVLD